MPRGRLHVVPPLFAFSLQKKPLAVLFPEIGEKKAFGRYDQRTNKRGSTFFCWHFTVSQPHLVIKQ